MTDINHTYWYLTRASGLVAYLLLFVSVSLGLTMTGDVLERWLRRHRIYDLHRFLSLITMGVVGFHALIVLGDGYFSFSLPELLLPFASPYRPLYMALGVFGLYLTALIVASFYVRGVLSYPVWRLVHYATFGAFVLALVHGIGAGTDTQASWAQYLYAVTGLVAFNLLVYRALRGSARGIPATRARDHGPGTKGRSHQAL
jgi:predicted ferric reductase